MSRSETTAKSRKRGRKSGCTRSRRAKRIEALKRTAAELSGGAMLSLEAPGVPPEILEAWWQRIVAYEQAETVAPFDLLVESGVELPPPGKLDSSLGCKLQEVIDGLASYRIYLDHTDHLSDRELYTLLWEEVLREEGVFEPEGPGFHVIDVVGSGSDEDILAYLEYYADDELRRVWAEDWPDLSVPEHRDPPHDRDRHLPQPSWEPHSGRVGVSEVGS